MDASFWSVGLLSVKTQSLRTAIKTNYQASLCVRLFYFANPRNRQIFTWNFLSFVAFGQFIIRRAPLRGKSSDTHRFSQKKHQKSFLSLLYLNRDHPSLFTYNNTSVWNRRTTHGNLHPVKSNPNTLRWRNKLSPLQKTHSSRRPSGKPYR